MQHNDIQQQAMTINLQSQSTNTHIDAAQLHLVIAAIIQKHQPDLWHRGFIAKPAINSLCKQLALLPYVPTQSQIKKVAAPLFKHIEYCQRATANTVLPVIEQANQLLNQAKVCYTQSIANLPKQHGRPLGAIIKGVYSELYRVFGIDAELGEIRHIVAIITPFPYADSQINEHLPPLVRTQIRNNIDAEKRGIKLLETPVYLVPPPKEPTNPLSNGQCLRQIITLANGLQIEDFDKNAIIDHIKQIADAYDIDISQN